MLLLRLSDSKWIIPGGNFNGSIDLEAFNAAMREATDYLGYLPNHEVQDSVITRWGPGEQKEFTVFLAPVPPSEKEIYLPRANQEEYRAEWIPLDQLDGMMGELHPILQYLWQPFQKAKVLTVASA